MPRMRTGQPAPLWITWERQRRSLELARALGAGLHVFTYEGNRYLRSLMCSVLTLRVLLKSRPRVVLVQNPSVQLAALACLLRKVLGYRLVVDRHSNFNFDDTEQGIFNLLSNYSIRKADLTVVTNQYVKDLVERKGGRGLILEDKLPELALATQHRPLSGNFNVLFICTYSPDEPVRAVLDAARLLPEEVTIHVTGNDAKLTTADREEAPPNVVFTGFLPESDYQGMLVSTDVVMALTTRDHTLLCGAYEAVSAGVPVVLSDKKALRDYFVKGVVFTDNTAEAIRDAIVQAREGVERLGQEVAELRTELAASWQERFEELRSAVAGLEKLSA